MVTALRHKDSVRDINVALTCCTCLLSGLLTKKLTHHSSIIMYLCAAFNADNVIGSHSLCPCYCAGDV